ncbi:MAG: AMP-binding protein [Gemmatimonadales bacterium]
MPHRIDDRSLGHLLVDRAARSGDRRFLRFEGREMTFAEVERASARVANRLSEMGVAPGDRVALMLPNGLEYPVCWLGVVRLGAIVVPVNTGYREADLSHVLRDSEAGTIITLNEFVPLVDRVSETIATVDRVLAWDGLSSVRGGNPEARLPFADQLERVADRHELSGLGPTTVSVLQYTSGTTGFPKGVMIPHGGWLQVARTYVAAGAFTEADVVAIMTAFYYGDFGWNLILCLLAGMELVLLPRFSASTLWRSLGETGATFFYCLGTMPVLLLKQPEDPAVDRGHRVRWVSCSGIPADRHADIERRWGVPWREAYGTTEIGFVTMTALDEDHLTGSGSIGRLTGGFEGLVVRPDGTEAAPGEIGEFICRGPALSLGYWNKPEATARWMQDGWAHTGDLMRRDEAGCFYLVGRTKDMIRRGGENIAAQEVEAVLAEHPGVAGAACVAVADEIRGEEVLAFVLPAYSAPRQRRCWRIAAAGWPPSRCPAISASWRRFR